MPKNNLYTGTDKMSDLICSHYNLLQVMSRFGLSLGIGDKTVHEVCQDKHIDETTFLAVVNMHMSDHLRMGDEAQNISVKTLMDYLKAAHHYFIDFALPEIKKDLTDALPMDDNEEVCKLIIQYFDRYIQAVRKHMYHENEDVFTYVEALLEGKANRAYNIDYFAREHEMIDPPLREFRHILIKYLPSTAENLKLNKVLFDIFACEDDLRAHCDVEEYLFIPAVRYLEKNKK